MSSEPKIAREVAEEQFATWAEANDLVDKLDPATLDDEDKRAFAAHREVLLRAMCKGTLVLNEDKELVFTPKFSKRRDELTVHFPSLNDLKAGDGAGFGNTNLRTQKILGGCTGKGSPHFAEFDGRDFTVLESIVTLFLAK